MEKFLSVFSGLLGIIIYALLTKRYLHITQLEGYKNRQVFGWLGKNALSSFIHPLLIFIAVSLAYTFVMYSGIRRIYGAILLSIVFLFSSVIYMSLYSKKKYKKPIVYTHRMIRLAAVNILVIVVETAGVYYYFPYMQKPEYILLWFSLTMVLASINTVLSNTILIPVEKIVHMNYMISASKKIASNKKLIRIGITGSYGKTSTKFILSTILAEKFMVLSTPESYNTTMGTTKVIREMLSDEHEVFISEMGARNPGDIKEICSIVKPCYGIITSIGKQHLETFKTIENIAKTKYELIEGLETDGTGFFPSDDDLCYNLYKKTNKKKILYGIDEHLDEVDIRVNNIELSENGSSFELTGKDGESVKCSTKLLGRHNVRNILGCAAVAEHLGLSLEEISQGIAKLEPVPHRLQILPTRNGTIVIDDAFNSNPVGTKMALDVLSQFKGRKIIITPGMVELGNEEYSLNREFGRDMAAVVDIAILVGKKRTCAIQEGLKDKDFSMENIILTSSLEEASSKLSSVIRAGDVILFENDLPDNYDE